MPEASQLTSAAFLTSTCKYVYETAAEYQAAVDNKTFTEEYDFDDTVCYRDTNNNTFVKVLYDYSAHEIQRTYGADGNILNIMHFDGYRGEPRKLERITTFSADGAQLFGITYFNELPYSGSCGDGERMTRDQIYAWIRGEDTGCTAAQPQNPYRNLSAGRCQYGRKDIEWQDNAWKSTMGSTLVTGISCGKSSYNSYEYEIPYVDGMKHGSEKQYDTSDQLRFEVLWENGEKTMEIVYGYEASRTPFKNNRIDGTQVKYQNGFVRAETPYVNGYKEGWAKVYNSYGRFIYEVLYESDKPVSVVCANGRVLHTDDVAGRSSWRYYCG
jgi:hypothetical protein